MNDDLFWKWLPRMAWCIGIVTTALYLVWFVYLTVQFLEQ